MSQTDSPTWYHTPNTKRTTGRCRWQELEAGEPVTIGGKTLYGEYGIDRSVESDTKKLRGPKNKSETKNRSRRSANRCFPQPSESDTLRSELSAVHRTYHKALQGKDDEIKSLKGHLLTINNLAARDIDSLNKERDDLQDVLDITEGELSIFQKSEKEWIGRALRLKFIFDQMKKIEALPEDHADWVDPMVEQVDIPEVSINIKNEFVPTAQTDNIDWVSSDEEDGGWDQEGDVIGEYETSGDLITPVNCTNCGEMTHATCDCTMPHGLISEQVMHGSMMNVFSPRMAWGATAMYNYRPHSRAIMEKSATTIQKAWQNHQSIKRENLDRELDDWNNPFNKWEWDSDGLHDEWAKVIQRVWRGYHLRKLLEAASNDRFHQGRESMRAEALLAHNVFFHYSGVPFPAEQL